MHKIILFVIVNFLSYYCFSQIMVSQKFPSTLSAGKDYTIETTINKGSSKSFLMFSQPIPIGFKVSEIESKGGRLKFADSLVKITWIIPPTENPFTISYQLSIPKNAPAEMIVSGSLFYLVDSVKKEFKLESKTIKIEGSAPQQKENNPVVESKPTEKTNSNPLSQKEKLSEEKTNDSPPLKQTSSSKGKTFKIQIGAFKTKHTFTNVPELSFIELDNGVIKYYSGNYATREEAVAHRASLIAKGYKDVFVVEFENGKIVK